jgi:hypothetical protein
MSMAGSVNVNSRKFVFLQYKPKARVAPVLALGSFTVIGREIAVRMDCESGHQRSFNLLCSHAKPHCAKAATPQ